MKILYGLLTFLIIQSCSTLLAQTENTKLSNYDKDGLRFEYPSDWSLTDKSSDEMQTLYLTKEGKNILIMVSSPREILQSAERLGWLYRQSHAKYTNLISQRFVSSGKEPESLCVDVGGRKISGTKYAGSYKDEQGTGEIYTFALGKRFMSLAYLKLDNENQIADAGWQAVTKSLSIKGADEKEDQPLFKSGYTDGGVMNGKALKLVKPKYDSMIFRSGAIGLVNVEILIDETGKVVSAKAVSGHKLLYKPTEDAALESRFRPTKLCDKPVQVRGVIVYNFYPFNKPIQD